MKFDHQLLFFFSALGAFNGSILSLYFFLFAKPKHLSNYFLGGMLLMLSIRIWKSVFFYFNPDLSRVYLQIGLSACFFIGPFLYAYVKTRLDKSFKRKLIFGQILLLLLVTLITGIIYPYEVYPELWGDVFYKIINYQWLLYILLSAYAMKNTFSKMINRSRKISPREFWALSVFTGVFIIWAAYFFASYTSYIMGGLSFTLVLYLSILVIYQQREKSAPETVKRDKYEGNKIDASDAEELLGSIDHILRDQQLFKDPNLTLPQLAEKVKVRPHLISQLLNDNLNKNFSLFINEYRISEARRILGSDSNLKMEVVAEMCGFNSKSTFYTAFKKITQTTPAKYANSWDILNS
ncbi:helix-turn-helix transcriptional regulator [Robertkochia flava]|uniref:helix-turn-helix transcriptional regulator n=1 Tax=Robertkochia flava TaxID=3447986 RepID=UPI001CCBFD61|nr:helix-turn-helix transcriptional regulator [Robertkochia marina]